MGRGPHGARWPMNQADRGLAMAAIFSPAARSRAVFLTGLGCGFFHPDHAGVILWFPSENARR